MDVTAKELGIPSLDLEWQLLEPRPPYVPYGTIPRTQRMPAPGTVHFFCQDAKFLRLFANPDRLFFTGCSGCIEPNPSTGPDVPMAAAIFGIFRKRWCAAYWQAAGIRIAVDLNVDDAVLPYALLGVPEGWRSYATRKHRHDGPEAIETRHALAVRHSGIPDPVFIVVGGGAKVHQMAKDRGWIHIPEQCRLSRMKGRQPWDAAGAEVAVVAGKAAVEEPVVSVA